MADQSGVSEGAKTTNEASYRLHNSDHPGMALVNTILDGKNYFGWSIAVRTALEVKEKVGFIDGSLPEPQDPTEYKKWKAVDSMIKSWIRNSLTKELAETFVCCLSSKSLWDILEERFGASNHPHLFRVQQEISSIRQGGDSVTTYYNKLHRWWDELDRLMPIPSCTCGKCTCGLQKKISDLMTSVKLIQFLMGLNPAYDVVNLSFTNTTEGASIMLAKASSSKADNSYKKYDVSKKDKICEHCNGKGHGKDTCFKIHGYPDWWKELKERRGVSAKKQVVATATERTVADTPVTQDSEQSVKGDLTSVVSYLLKEVQRLGKGKNSTEQVNFANLHDFAGNSNSLAEIPAESWIIDTGATSHMCSNKKLIMPLPTVTLEQDITQNEGADHTTEIEEETIEAQMDEEQIPATDVEVEPPINPVNQGELIRTSSRQKRQPIWMNDYVCLSKISELKDSTSTNCVPSTKKTRDNIPPCIIPECPLQIRSESRLLTPFFDCCISHPQLNHPLHQPLQMLTIRHCFVQIQSLYRLSFIMVPSQIRTRILLQALLRSLKAHLERLLQHPLGRFPRREVPQNLGHERLDECCVRIIVNSRRNQTFEHHFA
ncbi:uncharacterized protein G2W53_003241 [Senna tora]|uniref:Retrotransposon Copia-like N-terminal domain-containing protein n=1 Tax=Senna tora TaxID=362788 RepID=A0A834XCG6_9FABA|nr:uncharacterized protein G2W53_003241 [Senna tora]